MRASNLGKLLGIGVAAAWLAACVTAEQVRSIVADANASVIAADAAALEADPGVAPGEGWRDTVTRIENFIAEHPDDVRTNNALRIREAVMLLNADQPNLARAVFGEVDRAMLGSTRDLAIYDAREHLIWWHSLDTTEGQFARAQDALAGLEAVADTLERTDYTRRFLEETRIRIAVRFARAQVSTEDVQAFLDDATARYAEQWDEQDRRAIQAWHRSESLAENADLRSLRWYDYVPAAFADAEVAVEAVCDTNCPAYTPSWVACIAGGTC